MPDHANARLALRRLVAGLVAQTSPDGPTATTRDLSAELTMDQLLAELDTDEAATFQVVLDALDDQARDERGRFVYAVTEHDYQTGAPRRMVIIDTQNADGHQGYEAEFVAAPADVAKARTIVATMNDHPPVPAYDDEPF